MTERKRGRPKGSRNKVDVHSDIQRALKSGKTLTDIKEWIEEFIADSIKAKEDPKVIVALFKAEIQLIQYLQGIELKRQEDEDKEDDEDESEMGASGNVISFGNKK